MTELKQYKNNKGKSASIKIMILAAKTPKQISTANKEYTS
jgi:hypothetical protein